MIDLHSHVLPMVDDGSESLNHSLDMVKTAISQGVKELVLTPHYRGVFNLSKKELEEKFNDFKAQVQKENLPINLSLGQEIYVDNDTKKDLIDNKFLTINQTKYVLLEFNYTQDNDIAEYVYEFSRLGYKPIIAHVERYTYLTIYDIAEIKSMGALIQINAESLVGKGNFANKRLVKKLIKNDLVDIVSNDMHWGREYLMAKAYKCVCKKFSKDIADNLFIVNPQKVLNDE